MDNLIDINTLLHRYGLKSRQAVYDRLKDLKIKPARRGKITQEDLLLLDELDKHINSGGTIDNFVKSPEILSVDKMDKWEEPTETPTIEMLLALIEKILLHQLPLRSSLAQFEELEKVANNGWILPTSVVRSITGIAPKGDNFSRGSFVFIRVGKVGREAGWIVKKTALVES
ncbi:hypothetical protein ACE1AT_11040 [Pelatocladus sp. BLCC-F211]|uniref:hypothetical protein n=1 Tax=Pelatocladus sp. BLCC-F211 TaxID=3342752 RepID=UPI0035B7BFD3